MYKVRSYGNLIAPYKNPLVLHVHIEKFESIKKGEVSQILKPSTLDWSRKLKRNPDCILVIKGTPNNQKLDNSNTVVLPFTGYSIVEYIPKFAKESMKVLQVSLCI